MLIPHRNLIIVWAMGLIGIIYFVYQSYGDYRANYYSFLVLAILLLVSLLTWLMARSRRPQLRIERQVEELQQSGEEFVVSLLLENLSPFAFAFELFDHLPAGADTREMPVRARIDAKKKLRITYRSSIAQRGRFSFSDVQLRIPALFSCWIFDLKIPTEKPSILRVYPRFKYADDQLLRGITTRRPADTHPLHCQRGSGDFSHIRDYISGDPLNRIDHKASARTRKWCVREYENTYGQPVILILDASRRTASEHQGKILFDEILAVTSQLAKTALHKGDEVGLQIFSNRIMRWLPASRREGQYRLFTENLFDCFAQQHPPDFSTALRDIYCRQKERALIIFVSVPEYGDEQILRPLIRLLNKKHHFLYVAIRPTYLDHRSEVRSADDNFANAARDKYAAEFSNICRRLREEKIFFLETSPEKLRSRIINAYLEYKSRLRSV